MPTSRIFCNGKLIMLAAGFENFLSTSAASLDAAGFSYGKWQEAFKQKVLFIEWCFIGPVE